MDSFYHEAAGRTDGWLYLYAFNSFTLRHWVPETLCKSSYGAPPVRLHEAADFVSSNRRFDLVLISEMWDCTDIEYLDRYIPVHRRFRKLQAKRFKNLNKGWPTWWHLLYYLLFNMFRMLIHPSSGACDYLVRYCVSQPHTTHNIGITFTTR